MPQTPVEWKEVADEFYKEWDLPNVVGALDGKHIQIQCPKYGGSDFRNYKGFHSTNLMAICDAKYRFLWCDIGSYGRDNDAAVFGRSEIFDKFDNDQLGLPQPSNIHGHNLPYCIVGDEIFPLKYWLMKPYPGKNLSEEQTIYNYRLSRARRTIENAFGILAAKWRILRVPINANLDLVDLVVQSCVALHNYLLLTDNARYLPNGFVDCYSSTGDIVEGGWRTDCQINQLTPLVSQGSNNSLNYAKTVRDNLCSFVNSAEGSVPWQLAYVRDSGREEVNSQ